MNCIEQTITFTSTASTCATCGDLKLYFIPGNHIFLLCPSYAPTHMLVTEEGKRPICKFTRISDLILENLHFGLFIFYIAYFSYYRVLVKGFSGLMLRRHTDTVHVAISYIFADYICASPCVEDEGGRQASHENSLPQDDEL